MYRNESPESEASELRKAYALLKAISRAQEHVIREDAPGTLFQDLLDDLLTLTGSEYGNIGEISHDEQGQPYLTTQCCNVARSEATRSLFEIGQRRGMQFRRLDCLYGAVMTSGEPVIANDPANDPRRGGLPEGHPPLDSYLGIPVRHAGALVAMIGLANRPSGYDQALVDYLQPLIATYGQLIAHFRLRQLGRSTAQFRCALDNTVDNVLLIDPATSKFVDCNRSSLQRMGYSREELMAMGPTDIMPRMPAEAVEEVLHGDREYVECSTVHRCKDGSLFPVEVRLSKFSAERERPLLIAIARDISERKLAEEKYRLLATVVESTAEGVVISDTENRIVAVNKAFTDITGFEESEVLGRNPSLLRSGHHDPDFYAALWRALREQGFWQGELWDRRKNGEIFPTWSTISAVHDNGNRLTNYVSVFADISSIKQSEQQLEYLAQHDPLTHLPNRLLLGDRLDHALQRAHRDGHRVAVLFLDLDRFKNVNDSLGHPVGDQLLQEAATRIKQAVRENDTVARLGGDEFIIVMEAVREVQDVAILARKLIASFADPLPVKGHQLHLTLSVGVSLYPDDGQDGATLIRNADAAMYRAKEEGRNNYHFYTAALTAAILERLTMETALRQALDNGQLEVHYQPQYHLDTGRLSGAEALLRWRHPEKGLIEPTKFIPLAEDTGLIVGIGDWVLGKACQQARRWREQGLERVSVNVSGIQFQRGDIVGSVLRALEDSGLAPRHLELEITESVIMQKTDSAIQVLDELKAIGVGIAIDDFGTGYSSLSYLKRLPVDKLKIDRSFVCDIPWDGNDIAITRAVLALGKSLKLGVVAEGVETDEQHDFLRSIECGEAQGYRYGRPLPEEEFGSILAQA